MFRRHSSKVNVSGLSSGDIKEVVSQAQLINGNQCKNVLHAIVIFTRNRLHKNKLFHIEIRE